MRCHVGRRARDRGTYALLAPELARVKVGSSEDIDKRIRTIARCSPARLVLIGRCAHNFEIEIQRAIWSARIHAEWFAATDRTLAMIAKFLPRIDQQVSVLDLAKARSVA